MEMENKTKDKKLSNSLKFRIAFLAIQTIVILVIFFAFLIKYLNR